MRDWKCRRKGCHNPMRLDQNLPWPQPVFCSEDCEKDARKVFKTHGCRKLPKGQVAKEFWRDGWKRDCKNYLAMLTIFDAGGKLQGDVRARKNLESALDNRSL